MTSIRESIFFARDILWSGPLLVLLLGVGLYLTWVLRGIQFRYLFRSFQLLVKFSRNPEGKEEGSKKIKGDISGFQSLMTAMAGSIGTGSITGIATAVMAGGFGSLFWMWVVAFIGMATAYAETVLGLCYREINKDGEVAGGPMYTLLHGMKSPLLAALFAIFGAVACVGIGGMVQSNSVADGMVSLYGFNRWAVGGVLALLSGAVIIGGVKSIGRVAGVLVPFMGFAYIAAGGFILIYNFQHIPAALKLIIESAFTGQAAIGGFLGATVMMAIQNGAQFGVFANEAGLGSLSIAGACAKMNYTAERGILAICGVFLATMVICTLTGLVLAVTDVIGVVAANGEAPLTGSPLALAAFGSVHHLFRYVVLFSLILFAFTTILAWGYYGEKCVEYLFGLKASRAYRWLFTGSLILGAVFELETVWAFSHLANGLMAIPNLIAMAYLAKVVLKETKVYQSKFG